MPIKYSGRAALDTALGSYTAALGTQGKSFHAVFCNDLHSMQTDIMTIKRELKCLYRLIIAVCSGPGAQEPHHALTDSVPGKLVGV